MSHFSALLYMQVFAPSRTQEYSTDRGNLIDLLLKNMSPLYYCTPIAFSSRLNHFYFFSTVICCSWSSFFVCMRFPSLSSFGRKCIRPLYGATWVRFLININHSTGEKTKNDASLLISLQKRPFLLERRKRAQI